MDRDPFGPSQLVTRAEAAGILRVDQATVTRLAEAGEIWSIRLMGGERRYRRPQLRTFSGIVPQQRRSARA